MLEEFVGGLKEAATMSVLRHGAYLFIDLSNFSTCRGADITTTALVEILLFTERDAHHPNRVIDRDSRGGHAYILSNLTMRHQA